MATPTIQTFKQKSTAELLAYLQGFYPTMTGIILNLDGSLTISFSDTPPVGAGQDIIDILSSNVVWEQV